MNDVVDAPAKLVWDYMRLNQRPEADIFADIAMKLGVPKNKIITETKASNTGENIVFTYELLQQKKDLSELPATRAQTLYGTPYLCSF